MVSSEGHPCVSPPVVPPIESGILLPGRYANPFRIRVPLGSDIPASGSTNSTQSTPASYPVFPLACSHPIMAGSSHPTGDEDLGFGSRIAALRGSNATRYSLRPRGEISYLSTRLLSDSGATIERGIYVLPNLGDAESDSSYAPSDTTEGPADRFTTASGNSRNATNATSGVIAESGSQDYHPESYQDLLPWLVGHAIQDRRILSPGENLPSLAEDRDERLGAQLLTLERIFPRSPTNRVFRLYTPEDQILERLQPTLRGIRNPWYRIPRSLCSEWIAPR